MTHVFEVSGNYIQINQFLEKLTNFESAFYHREMDEVNRKQFLIDLPRTVYVNFKGTVLDFKKRLLANYIEHGNSSYCQGNLTGAIFTKTLPQTSILRETPPELTTKLIEIQNTGFAFAYNSDNDEDCACSIYPFRCIGCIGDDTGNKWAI